MLKGTVLALALAFGGGAAIAMANDSEAAQPGEAGTAAEGGVQQGGAGMGVAEESTEPAGGAGADPETGEAGARAGTAGDGMQDLQQTRGQQSEILSTLQQRGQFSQTVDAIERAGLTEILAGPGPFTFFAPTDAAWSELPEDKREALLRDASRLRMILSYHIVPDEIRIANIERMGALTTIQGQPIHISGRGGQITVNEVEVAESPIQASNGVIYPISGVLVPAPRQ